jgi:hypothetical protein
MTTGTWVLRFVEGLAAAAADQAGTTSTEAST